MDVTSQLLRVFNVEKQIRGLQSRLTSAEKFLSDQVKQLAALDAKKAALDAQAKQLTATTKDNEGETARIDARMATIKTQMDSAQTNKEYKAFLTEHSTLKAERDRYETAALESMQKLDEVKKQLADIETQRAERDKMRSVALSDRNAREAEIAGRLSELKAERTAVVKDVPAETLKILEGLLKIRGDEAMAPIEEQDRKRFEFTCGSCMMTLTMESITGLLSSGKLTRCTACGCILYVDKALAELMQQPSKR